MIRALLFFITNLAKLIFFFNQRKEKNFLIFLLKKQLRGQRFLLFTVTPKKDLHGEGS